MMAKMNAPNPLDVLCLRCTQFPPDHFEYVDMPFRYNLEDSLTEWILVNLSGRYYVGRNVKLDDNRRLVNTVTIGFEDPKELSYFMLACPILKYNG